MTDTVQIPTEEEIAQFGLGRLPAEDPRDHRIQTLLDKTPVLVKRSPFKYYSLPALRINQGNTPRCVEYSWRNQAMTGPIRQLVQEAYGVIYNEAQKIDEWPGENYEGTSVRAGAKVMQAHGYLTNYAFAKTLDELLDWVLGGFGPVVMGTNWYEGMFRPDRNGFLLPTGGIAGGHAWTIYGANERTKTAYMINSWGPAWGINGRAKLSFETLERLIHEEGEACTPTEILKKKEDAIK